MAGGITAVTMPKWGIEMTEGTINDWSAREGQAITKGEVLLQVETEKIVNDVEAPASGTLRKIIASRGETRPVGALIGVLADAHVTEADVEAFIASFKGATVSFEPDAPAAAHSTTVSTEAGTGDTRVSPIARRLAERLGVDLAKVKGTGRNGRISKEDVEAFVASQSAPASATVAQAQLAQEPTARQRLSPTRATIARRLLEAKQTIPHYRLDIEVDVGRLLARKVELTASSGVAISVNDLLVHAVARALIRHPGVNVQFVGDEVLGFAHADVAIAVATDSGVVAPIVRSADRKSPAEIAIETADLIRRAGASQLKREDIAGGTFTLSNLGMFGIARFDAIINPPQVAILAVGAAEERVVVRQGAPAVARMMTLTLSADHRVIDGALAAAFLGTLRELLQSPMET
jgi:pyruvate dehydrogenase E2 component (dihydrolipoamide acetyltransferase)